MRRLPPLAAVRVFEAAGRHENFTTAAAELGMTQAAVSYQVRALEERLGVPLFRRERRRVMLTEAGRRALGQVTAAFDTLDAAFAGLRAEDEGVLTISVTPTMATCWLASRIGAFQMAHPELAVRLDTTNRLVDFVSEDIDCALRSGSGDWPGLIAEPLFDVDFTPMAGPTFLAQHGGHIAPEAMADAGIVSLYDPWWKDWYAAVGAPADHHERRSGIRLDSQALEGSAVRGGQGIALLTPFLWWEDVAEGRLVRLSPVVASAGDRYWLVYPEHRRRAPKIARFRKWLTGEVQASLASLASLDSAC